MSLGRSEEWEAPNRTGTTRLDVLEDGTLAGTLRLALTGDAKLGARSELQPAEEPARRAWCERVLQGRLAGVELKEYRLDGVEPRFDRVGEADTLLVRMAFQLQGFLPPGKGAAFDACLLAAPLQDPLGEEARTVAIWQPQSRGEYDEVSLQLPAWAALRDLPAPATVNGQFLRYAMEMSSSRDPCCEFGAV